MITRLNPANEVQAAIITALKADAQVTASVPASRIYPPQLPNTITRPFIQMGVPVVTARYVDCHDDPDGATVDLAIHCFVTRTSTINDPRKFALDVASLIARCVNRLDATEIDTDAGMAVHVGQVQVLREENADSWHSFVTIRAEV